MKLLAAIVNNKLRVRAGKRVTLEYLSTAVGSTTLEVFKGRTRIARVNGKAKTGRNKITWNGERGRKKASRGKYALRLSITSGDGQTATDRGRVTLIR